MDVAVVRKAVDTIRRSNGSRRVGPTTAATNTAGARTRIHWICNMRGGIMAIVAHMCRVKMTLRSTNQRLTTDPLTYKKITAPYSLAFLSARLTKVMTARSVIAKEISKVKFPS